jgi:phospholipid/cholesterol/gamma-HCH transport system ATP-binding protein
VSHIWETLTCVIPEKENKVPESNLLEVAVPPAIAVAARVNAVRPALPLVREMGGAGRGGGCRVGAEVVVEGLAKFFGRKSVWQDVSLTIPAGEVSVMLGPSGTGKTVFLKSLVGLLRPEYGHVYVDGTDIVNCSERQLYRARRLFGLMFQDGALFGSLSLFDNIAFPLREHTKLREREIRDIVADKMALVGLAGEEGKLPGQISGGMRKRAGLARALVLEPQIILCDEPDSGLDPVRTSYLSQLLIDLNARTDATILIVTHNIQIATTVPDNIGMLFRGELVGFGPREIMLTSQNPVIGQFLEGRRIGPIGMAEEKDQATMEVERAHLDAGHHDGGTGTRPLALAPQLSPTPGVPARQAVLRRRERVMSLIETVPPQARDTIVGSFSPADFARYEIAHGDPGAQGQPGPGSQR